MLFSDQLLCPVHSDGSRNPEGSYNHLGRSGSILVNPKKIVEVISFQSLSDEKQLHNDISRILVMEETFGVIKSFYPRTVKTMIYCTCLSF